MILDKVSKEFGTLEGCKQESNVIGFILESKSDCRTREGLRWEEIRDEGSVGRLR